MAAANKTQQGTALLALQNVPLSSQVISSVFTCTNTIAAAILIHFGRCSGTAYTTPPTFRIEGQFKSAATGFWAVLQSFSAQIGSAFTAQAVNGTCLAAQNVIPMTTTSAFSLQGYMYVKNTTIANGEFGAVKSIVASTSITIEDNLNNAQTGSTCYAQAERYLATLDLTPYSAIRLVVDNSANATTGGIDVEAWINTFDSFS